MNNLMLSSEEQNCITLFNIERRRLSTREIYLVNTKNGFGVYLGKRKVVSYNKIKATLENLKKMKIIELVHYGKTNYWYLKNDPNTKTKIKDRQPSNI